MKQRNLTDDIVYYPSNGAVVQISRDDEGKETGRTILVRLVYANRTITETILEALKKKYTSG